MRSLEKSVEGSDVLMEVWREFRMRCYLHLEQMLTFLLHSRFSMSRVILKLRDCVKIFAFLAIEFTF